MSNLPDNCTPKDIDRAFGPVSKCCECHKTFPSKADPADDDGTERYWCCRKCANRDED